MPGTKPQRPGPNRKRSSTGRIIGRIVVLGLFGVTAFGIGLAYRAAKVATGDKGSPLSILETFQNPRGLFPGKDRVNILLIGKDYNRDSKGMPFTKNSRSDSIMMLSLDLENKKASALSIPRDSWVHAPDGQTGKINGTYARGGAELLTQTVGELLGVKPDYYIAIKADAVKNMVDTVGGVDVETIDHMKYDDEWGQLHVNLPKGPQTINGTQAIGFARFREADIYQRHEDGTAVRDSAGNALLRARREIEHSKEEGDPRRMARQQQLIRAILTKAKDPTNILRAPEIINTTFDQLDTSLERKQITALAAIFRNISPDQMQTGTLQGEGTKRGRVWAFFPDEEKTKALVDWLIKGDETAANRLTVVAVQNGTEVKGVARKVATMLKEEGFDASAGNMPHGEGDDKGEVTATRIVYGKASVAPRAKRIAQLLGIQDAQVVKQPRPDATGTDEAPADVTIVLGRDIAANFSSRSAQR
jgi:LCP family protein required for cell wall assembly